MSIAGNMQKDDKKLSWHLNLIVCSASMVILLRMLFNGDLQPLGCSPGSKLYTTHGYLLHVLTLTADSSLQRMKTRRNKKDPNMPYVQCSHITFTRKQNHLVVCIDIIYFGRSLPMVFISWLYCLLTLLLIPSINGHNLTKLNSDGSAVCMPARMQLSSKFSQEMGWSALFLAKSDCKTQILRCAKVYIFYITYWKYFDQVAEYYTPKN